MAEEMFLFEVGHCDEAGDFLEMFVESQNGRAVLQGGNAGDDVGQRNHFAPLIQLPGETDDALPAGRREVELKRE